MLVNSLQRETLLVDRIVGWNCRKDWSYVGRYVFNVKLFQTCVDTSVCAHDCNVIPPKKAGSRKLRYRLGMSKIFRHENSARIVSFWKERCILIDYIFRKRFWGDMPFSIATSEKTKNKFFQLVFVGPKRSNPVLNSDSKYPFAINWPSTTPLLLSIIVHLYTPYVF